MSAQIGYSWKLWVAVLAVSFLGSPAQVLASSMWCEQPRIDATEWAERSMSDADTVILGRVVSIEEIPQAQPSPAEAGKAKSMAELIRRIEAANELSETRFDHVVSFAVIESWKDPVNPIVRTSLYLGKLKEIRAFQRDEVYLVVGRNLEGTLYRIDSRCLDAIREVWAQEYVDALDALNQ